MVCACGVCSCSSGVMSNPITEGCVGRAAPCDVAAIARCRSPSRARATLKPPSSSVFRAQALRCCRSLVSRRPQLCIYTGVAFVEQESFTCRGLFIVVVVLRRSSSLKSSSLQVVDVHSSGNNGSWRPLSASASLSRSPTPVPTAVSNRCLNHHHPPLFSVVSIHNSNMLYGWV